MNTETQDQLERALAAIDRMAARLEASERSRVEPIAIVGAGCRFPGAVNLAGFWKLLMEGGDATGPVPAERKDFWSCFDRDVDSPGKSDFRHGGFIGNLTEFDAPFFRISPKEAAAMDPQQRLLLELAWESLEDACIPPEHLFQSATGVFIGACSADFALWRARNIPRERIDAYLGTGTALSVAAGRISYFLGLCGPAMTIDTACSSSLVAVHQAISALRLGECNLALAGGVSLLLAPELSIGFSKARMLAADGRCKTFDAAADGFARAEGGGLIVLKRLRDAIRDGDRIRATIAGSAVNQDGASGGLTVPSGPSQEDVIRRSLRAAKWTPGQVDCLEAHGTGTALGDPIEVRAINNVFSGRGRSLAVGSVKTNIGHAEAAAGIAGLIKCVLAVEAGWLPRHNHLHVPNPNLDLNELPIAVPATTVPWPGVADAPRRAGVSAFGFSGTNAHVLVEQAPPRGRGEVTAALPLFVLSAQSTEALRELAGSYASFLGESPEPAQGAGIRNLCAALWRGRSHLPVRLALFAHTWAQLASVLGDFAQAQPARGLVSGDATSAPKVAFLFAGQAGQYARMGEVFAREFAGFRATLERCDRVAAPLLGRSLLDLVTRLDDPDLIEDTALAQPALFAMEVALALLWKDFGVVPQAVFGHSLGEIGAAAIAGIFSVEDGIRIAIARGWAMGQIGRPGGMSLVALPAAEVERSLCASTEVAIAAVNGPRGTVISGPLEGLQVEETRLRGNGAHVTRLKSTRAFHSPEMAPAQTTLARALEAVAFHAAEIPIVSAVTGRFDERSEMSTAAYWLGQMLAPVQFERGVRTLLGNGLTHCVEVGPGAELSAAGMRIDEQAVWLPTLRRGEDEPLRFCRSLAQLYVAGCEVRPETVAPDPWPRQTLPLYPFQRRRHWLEDEESAHTGKLDDAIFQRCWRRADRSVSEGVSAATHARWILCGSGSLVENGSRSWEFLDGGTSPEEQVYVWVKALRERLVRATELERARGWVIVTQCAQPVGAEVVNPAATAIWAWAETAHREYPEIPLWLVDVEDLSAPVLAQLENSRLFQADRHLLALRNGAAYQPELTYAKWQEGQPALRKDGAYLVTGAFGALGTRVADWLVNAGARHLLLVGRRAPSEPARLRLEAWRAMGARIECGALDVADAQAVNRLVGGLQASSLPLCGIVHCAGELADGLLMQQTDEAMRRAMAAKVEGSWNLHTATLGMRLDFFLGFSSAAALLGSTGQSHYAAGNAFLDGLAHFRRALGLPMTSVQWGPWKAGGMAAQVDRAWPSEAIDAASGTQLLGKLMACPLASVAVLPEPRWTQFAQALGGPRWIEGLCGEPAKDACAEPPGALRSFLNEAEPENRPALLRTWIATALAGIAGFEPSEIDAARGFAELGLDSLMAMRLRARIVEATGFEIDVTAVFNYPTIERLAEYLLHGMSLGASGDRMIGDSDAESIAAREIARRFAAYGLAGENAPQREREVVHG